jgi:4-alpha-glucanotransferase
MHPLSTLPTSPEYVALLEEAARRHGIETEYWDIWGKHHRTSPTVIASILHSLGVPCETVESVSNHLGKVESEAWRRAVPRTLVIGRGQTIRLRVPGTAEKGLELVVHLENGESIRQKLALDSLPVADRKQLGTEQILELEAPLPPELPFGYHRLVVRHGASVWECRLICTPDRAWLPESLERGERIAGVAVSLYGVRSDRNWGCGDFTDLSNLLGWLKDDVNGSFLALNPLHAIENRQPYNISPYLPTSSLFRNPLYLDLERIPEFSGSEAAGRMASRPEHRERVKALRDSEFVRYEDVWRYKRFFLKILYREFRRGKDVARTEAFRAFQQDEGEKLERFSLYCALWEWLHRRDRNLWIWPEWPAAYQDPESEAVAEFRRKNRRRIEFYSYLQWLIDEQLGEVQAEARRMGLPVGLYHDLALATDRCGADLWGYRKYYVNGCRVGSPPDGFAPDGQDWAFPPPDSDALREDGYQFFVDCIRANGHHGGALRLDHVMRLFRLFWIPDGVDAKDGTYVLDHHEDLLRIMALESHRGKFFIVGEDLGTVTDAVRRDLERFGILSYKVFYFEKQENGRFRRGEEYPRQALVSSTTHDLPTLAGFWTNRDIEARRGAGLLPDDSSYRRQIAERATDKQKMLEVLREGGLLPAWFPRNALEVPELTGELHNAIIGFLVQTPSMVLVLNQEDLTKETEQQNLPASTYQYPNWQRKMKYTVEELRRDRVALDCAAMFRNWLAQGGRTAGR